MKSIQQNFFHLLATILDAETQLLQSLEDWIASCDYPCKEPQLKTLLGETEGHVTVLSYVFLSFRESPQRVTCEPVAEFIRNHNLRSRRFNPDTPAQDVALSSVLGRIRVYKTGVYSILHQWAGLLKNESAAAYLFELLDEEKRAGSPISSVRQHASSQPVYAAEQGELAMHM